MYFRMLALLSTFDGPFSNFKTFTFDRDTACDAHVLNRVDEINENTHPHTQITRGYVLPSSRHCSSLNIACSTVILLYIDCLQIYL